jgi:hypothetical protein
MYKRAAINIKKSLRKMRKKIHKTLISMSNLTSMLRIRKRIFMNKRVRCILNPLNKMMTHRESSAQPAEGSSARKLFKSILRYV